MVNDMITEFNALKMFNLSKSQAEVIRTEEELRIQNFIEKYLPTHIDKVIESITDTANNGLLEYFHIFSAIPESNTKEPEFNFHGNSCKYERIIAEKLQEHFSKLGFDVIIRSSNQVQFKWISVK